MSDHFGTSCIKGLKTSHFQLRRSNVLESFWYIDVTNFLSYSEGLFVGDRSDNCSKDETLMDVSMAFQVIDSATSDKTLRLVLHATSIDLKKIFSLMLNPCATP